MRRSTYGNRLSVAIPALLALLAACAGGGDPSESPMCSALEVPNDKSTHVPRPDETAATFSFPGNMPEQREFVLVHEDGSYDYVERWDMGVPHHPEYQLKIGWDWKVGCRMHVCPMPDGATCCHQVCRDGGDEGAAYEPPEAFGCMNSAAGGEYDWFVEGLRAGGMDALAACR
jgi:hypothetical protein